MKLSARNILKGKVVAVTKGVTTQHVKIDIEDLKLKKGDDAYAIIKASEVIVGKE